MNLLLNSKFLNDVVDEVDRARDKFPDNKHMYAALAEEAGEVANALLERDYKHHDEKPLGNAGYDRHVWDECVQTAAMCLRVATEGDPSFRYRPPDIVE